MMTSSTSPPHDVSIELCDVKVSLDFYGHGIETYVSRSAGPLDAVSGNVYLAHSAAKSHMRPTAFNCSLLRARNLCGSLGLKIKRSATHWSTREQDAGT